MAAVAWLSVARASPRAYEGGQGAGTQWIGNGIDLRRDGSNYFLINFCDMRDGCAGGSDRELSWAKFRVDLEYDILRVETPKRYVYATFPFRIRSFWDVFSKSPNSKSAPFVESNYSPGVELSWAPGATRWHWRWRPLITAGVRHESNGLGFFGDTDQEANSRSWNHVYGALSLRDYSSRWLRASLRFETWLPFGSEKVGSWPASRDRLEDHIGYGALRGSLQTSPGSWSGFTLTAEARVNSADLELRWNIKNEHYKEQQEERVKEKCDVKRAESHFTQDIQAYDQHLPTPAPSSSQEACEDEVATRSRDSEREEPDSMRNYFRLDLVVHCFFGKGERLIVADQDRYACYAGLGF